MAGDIVYDLCIVGAGMFGSAAARHATIKPGIKVCLIGPEEPKSLESSSVFAQYYDEGRITRNLDVDPISAKLGSASIARYRQLEKDTGIDFYEARGCLVMAHNGHQHIQEYIGTAKHLQTRVEQLSGSDIRQRYPDLYVPDNVTGFVIEGGYINPRKMVCAEQTAAHLQGCDVIRDVVSHVIENNQSQNKKANMKVITQGGRVIHAQRVLLATGAFTGFNQLMPEGLAPDIELQTETFVLAEISKQDAETLKYLPCVTYRGDYYYCELPADPAGIDIGFYYLPPILYPDGKIYMKIGHFDELLKVLTTQEEVKAWYCNPPPLEYTTEMTGWLKKLFPGVTFQSFRTGTCVATYTKSGIPYVDLIHPGLGVAIGTGCGAKECDEMGRMAADLMLTGSWQHEMPADRFRFLPKQTGVKAKI